MSELVPIDRPLLADLAATAGERPRRRANHNFHVDLDAACQRLLVAIEPDSYVRPHLHRDPAKAETLVVLAGGLGVLVFDADGRVRRTLELRAGGDTPGVDIPAGVLHAVVALAPGTVFFEAKAGPYRPVEPDEFGAWAPPEGAPQADAYRAWMRGHFA